MFRFDNVPTGGGAHEKVTVPDPVVVALPASVTVPPDATVYGPPALAVTVQGGGGATLLGQGLSCPTSVPGPEVYPPCARKSMLLKLFSTIGAPGTFSGKMYSKIGAWYWP